MTVSEHPSCAPRAQVRPPAADPMPGAEAPPADGATATPAGRPVAIAADPGGTEYDSWIRVLAALAG